MTRSPAKLGPVQLGIIVLTLATAIIHLTLTFPSFLFISNGLGYLALLAAIFAPLPFLGPYRQLARWALLAYTAVTVILWVVMGSRIAIGYISKAIEIALIVLLWLDLRRE